MKYIFPTGYATYHHDCTDGYGGVFVACHDTLISQIIYIHSNESSCKLSMPHTT